MSVAEKLDCIYLLIMKDLIVNICRFKKLFFDTFKNKCISNMLLCLTDPNNKIHFTLVKNSVF